MAAVIAATLAGEGTGEIFTEFPWVSLEADAGLHKYPIRWIRLTSTLRKKNTVAMPVMVNFIPSNITAKLDKPRNSGKFVRESLFFGVKYDTTTLNGKIVILLCLAIPFYSPTLIYWQSKLPITAMQKNGN